jgi:hypothetical protein
MYSRASVTRALCRCSRSTGGVKRCRGTKQTSEKDGAVGRDGPHGLLPECRGPLGQLSTSGKMLAGLGVELISALPPLVVALPHVPTP